MSSASTAPRTAITRASYPDGTVYIRTHAKALERLLPLLGKRPRPERRDPPLSPPPDPPIFPCRHRELEEQLEAEAESVATAENRPETALVTPD